MIFQFSKFGPKLSTFGWDTLYKDRKVAPVSKKLAVKKSLKKSFVNLNNFMTIFISDFCYEMRKERISAKKTRIILKKDSKFNELSSHGAKFQLQLNQSKQIIKN